MAPRIAHVETTPNERVKTLEDQLRTLKIGALLAVGAGTVADVVDRAEDAIKAAVSDYKSKQQSQG